MDVTSLVASLVTSRLVSLACPPACLADWGGLLNVLCLAGSLSTLVTQQVTQPGHSTTSSSGARLTCTSIFALARLAHSSVIGSRSVLCSCFVRLGSVLPFLSILKLRRASTCSC